MYFNNIALSKFLLAVCLVLAPAIAGAGRGQQQDEAFLAARDAYNAGNVAKLARYAPQLDGHLLYPWVDYWNLKLRIDDARPEEVSAFFRRQADTPLAQALRRDWLLALGKKERWDLFLRELPLLEGEYADVGCYALLARWRQNDASALTGVKAYWYSPRELPEGCVPLVQEDLRTGLFGSREIWARFRILMDANLASAAKRTLGRLPRPERIDPRRIDAATSSPARFLERSREPKGEAARELAILALSRLARNDPEHAATLWEKMRSHFPAEDRRYVWGVIATQGARKHLADAADWFAEVGNSPMTDEQLAWWARLALRQKSWGQVRAAIERMSPRARVDQTWAYWNARAMRELGQVEAANAEFARIAGGPQFYSQLAAEELGRRVQIPPTAAPPTKEEMAQAAANPGLQRALALYRFEMRTEGAREWNWAIRAMDDRMLLAAAALAYRNEIWDRSISTADRTVALHDYALRYPAPYRDVLAEQARSRELEEHWVLGLIRQESRFRANARSAAGASGLMQLMPSTARSIAKKLRLRGYTWARVTDVEVNAALGTAYLKQVLDDLDGSTVLAATAYNAGPGRARRWRDARPLEGAVYAETIPFNETRDYVKKVMANTVFYSAVLGGPMRTLKERLGVIAPRGSAGRLAALGDSAP